MSLIKKPYEISVWEDVIVYVGVSGAEYNSISEMSEAVKYQYYTERELAIIGSSTMTSPARTINNVFKKNINGVITLTFDMYYQYEDVEEGEIIHSPLIDLVIDERKIKLYYENKWYDFIVKKDDEKGREYKYSFTCTGLAANELGKTGFNIELDVELENNTGTIKELGKAVLEGSDWQLAEEECDIIQQTNDEALYLIKLNRNITGYIRGSNPISTKPISSGSWIYVYYTTYINQEKDYFQFIYVDNASGLGTPNLFEDKITINCNNEPNGTYDLYLTDVTWVDGEPNFRDTSATKAVGDYRGRRYVRKQLMDYDPVLEQTIYKYKGKNDNKIYHGYTTTEYLDATSVINYIYNSTDFSGTSYWTAYNGASIDARTYPDVNGQNLYTVKFEPYLIVNFNSNTSPTASRVVNEGIIQNYSRINSFEKGEWYRFKIWVGTLIGPSVTPGTIPFKCVIKKYSVIDRDITGDNGDKIYFTFNGNGEEAEDGYYYIDAQCAKSATWDDLSSRVGIFLYPRSNSNLNVNYYIKDIQLYRRISNDEGGYLNIGDVPQVRTRTNYHFYDPSINLGKTSAADYVFADNNEELYSKLYGSGDNEFEKVRSITAKESNRFNLLQELSETFECWVRFEIEHETNGQIKIEQYDYYESQPNLTKAQFNANKTLYYIYDQFEKKYVQCKNTDIFNSTKIYYKISERKRQIKKVIFYGEILEENFVGFKYGINLKDNNRTLDSEQIVTKIIVKDNNCEVAKNGFCTIARAQDNPIKENFALNLDYYVTQGLINVSNLNNDLYLEQNGSIGLYPKLSRLNNGYTDSNGTTHPGRNQLIETQAAQANSLCDLQSSYQTAQLKYDEATKGLSKLLDPVSGTIFKYSGYQYEDFGDQCTRVKVDPGEIEQGIISAETHDNAPSPYCVRTKDYIQVTPGSSYIINTNLKQVMVQEFSNNSDPTNSFITKTVWRYGGCSVTLGDNTRYLRILIREGAGIPITPSNVEYLNICSTEDIPAYGGEIYYIKGAINSVTPTPSLFCIKNTDTNPVSGQTYYTLENNHFKLCENITKFSTVETYYKRVNTRYTSGTYFQTANNTDTLTINTNNTAPQRIPLGTEDFSQGTISASTHDDVDSLYRIRSSYLPISYSKQPYLFDTGFDYMMVESFTSMSPESFIKKSGWINGRNQLYTIPSGTTYIRILLAKSKGETTTRISPTDITFPITITQVLNEVYVYSAARRVMEIDNDDYLDDNAMISKIASVNTLQLQKDSAFKKMNEVQRDLEIVQAEYDDTKEKLSQIAKATEEIEKDFNTKYSRYIQEGSWSDDNYMDDDLYYFDALDVLYQSAYPKVSYTFRVLELSQLEGYEAFTFDIGHKTYVEDTEFFGYYYGANGLKTPVREIVVVTEATLNFDEPEKNDLKIQNYKSHFEDLFQRITAATQGLEYHSGEYGRAAAAIGANGMISESVMSKTMANATYIIQNSRDQSIVWGDTGIIATNLNDPKQITRLASAGILVSADGGETWGVAISGYGINADRITAGTINADLINIVSGSWPTFKWDADGLRAYAFETDNGVIRSYDPTKYVTHDRWGIYGLSGYLTPPNLDTITAVENNATFALTWNGLFVKSKHRDGYIRISPTEDIVLKEYKQNGDVTRGKFGKLGEESGKEVYGLALYDENGVATVETKSAGTLWLKSQMDIGIPNRTSQIYIGVGQEATQEEKNLTPGVNHGKKVFRVYGDYDAATGTGAGTNIDRFAVYEDGYQVGHGAYHDGPINASSGTIGGLSVEKLPDAVGIKIDQKDGDTFKLDENGVPTPTSLRFSYVSCVPGTESATWYYGPRSSSMTPVPSGWISGDGVVTLTYSTLIALQPSPFQGGLMYLKCVVNGVYSATVCVKLNKDGKAADAYSYNIDSSEGYIINVNNTTGNTTILTASVYKNNEELSWDSDLSSITWYYKTDDMSNFEAAVLDGPNSIFTRVTSGVDYIVELNYLNFESIQIRFSAEEASA